jgi:dehydrogenase/reductase SDR family member 12
VTRVLDALLDDSLLGYTKVGPAVRRAWWPADPAADALVGKTVLVTGATSGLGEAAARSFAELGATVHLLGRNPEKVRTAAARLREHVPNAEVVEQVCDVGDLDAVRAWAATSAPAELHGLVHNAGTMTDAREESPQGHELALAVHVLGPHLMSTLLRPALEAGRASVVWVGSGGMYGARLRGDADGIEYRDGEYDGVQAYARTKRMQVVLAEEWAARLDGTDVRVTSMHPGWAMTPGVDTHLPTFRRVTGPLLRDPASGADTAVWLVATRPASYPPHFWHDRRQRPTTYGWQRAEDPAVVASFLAYVDGATA